MKTLHRPSTNAAFRRIVAGLISIVSAIAPLSAANPAPTWHIDARCLLRGQAANDYDYYGVKDPTIVFTGGKYHVFFTGAARDGRWVMLHAAAPSIEALQAAPRTYLRSLDERYFCAPQVFFFEPHGKWYLIYQDGTYGGAYATTATIDDPTSWSGPHPLGIVGGKGYDFYAIADESHVYLFNTPSDKSRTILVRRTTLADFPRGWGPPSVALADTFEAVAVYRSLADRKFYLIVEDDKDNRYFELWTAERLSGPWTKVSEQWASRHNVIYRADRWTENISHGEFIRAGVNQKLEIHDIDRVEFLIQGSPSGSFPNYQQIPYDLGIIRNYNHPTSATREASGQADRGPAGRTR